MPPSNSSSRSSRNNLAAVIGLILVAFVHLIYLADYAFRYLGKGLIAWDAPAWFGVFPVLSLVILLGSILLLVLRRVPNWIGWVFLALGFLWSFFALAAAINPSPGLWVFITEHAWLQGTTKVSVLNPVVGYTFYFLAFVTWLVIFLLPGKLVLRLGGLCAAWAMWWVGSSLVTAITPPPYLG
jgi:hypothetical protein